MCIRDRGYGEGHGVPHKSKPLEALCRTEGPMPDWFRRGMEAALLAPTATNQQKFRFTPVSYTHLDVYKRQLWCFPPARW